VRLAAFLGWLVYDENLIHNIGVILILPQVHPLLPGQGGLSPLLASCISCSAGRLLSEVAAAADPQEFWGPGRQGLVQYLEQNFLLAAVQGRLFVRPGVASNSSSDGSSSSRPGSAAASRLPMFGVGAILALREQREQEAAREAQRATLLFNTGLVSAAGQQVLMLFKEGSGAGAR
jgi:hypothetical protein